ncbi:MAG: PAS domain-containing protein [Proteobacteria bacterium]|nr:PAS domain-containing protein [Pseudomonadota bacterium]
MAVVTRNWQNYRRLLWTAAAAFAIGGLLANTAGRSGIALIFALAAIAALGAFVVARANRHTITSPSDGTDPSLAILPALAGEIFEQLPDPLMLIDAGGRVLFANKAMRSAVGTDAARKPVSSVLRTPEVLQAIDRTTKTGASSTIEFSVHVPVMRQYQAYITRTEQSPRLTALLLHDMTAIKRSEMARADFVANASHELRTPLAAVSGFIDTLRGHAKDDEKAREQFLDIMSVEAGRMRRLIDDLLSLTRIEQNEHVPPRGAVNVEAVVRSAAAVLAPLAKADHVTVEISADPSLPDVIGEHDELMQLFQNLIHNAIKYGKPSGHVWIKLASVAGAQPVAGRSGSESMLAVSIRDDGEGIPREAISRLTERFYRVDVKRSREKGGTGLGLAIVKHIVNRHRGRLQIDSQPGEGSTFTIYLPSVG